MRYSQYGWSVIGRIYGVLGPSWYTLLSSTYRVLLNHRYEYQREIQYTEEYGEVLLEDYVRLLDCCGSN